MQGRGQQPDGVRGHGTLQQGLAVGLPLVDQRGGHGAGAKARVVHQVAQEAGVVVQTQQRRVVQRGDQAADRVVAVAPVHDQLGHHRVVVRADLTAFADAVVNAHAVEQGLLGAPPGDVAGLRRKAGIRVFGVQARLDGVAAQRDLVLREGQGLARGHAQLPLHQVQARDHLGDRVLHLQAGVHLQEVVVQVLVDDVLDGAGAAVVDRLGGQHRVAAHGFAHGGAHDRRR